MSIDMELKAVFENMDYGTVQEPDNLAREWLTKYKCTFPPDANSADGDLNTVVGIHADFQINIISNPKNTEKLIENSKNALKLWTDGEKRRKLLICLATELVRHEALICQLEMVVRNILPKDTKNIAIPIFTDFLRYYASLALVLQMHHPQKHPCGTFVFEIQDEIPLCVLSFILPAALAAGNVVIIHAQHRLLPMAFLLSELCKNIGFPEGVVSVSTASLEDLLNSDITNLYMLHSSMYYPKCGFLRSRVTALQVSRTAKMIIFDSADLDSACDAVPDAAWSCNGKLPWSINEVYVQESIFVVFVEKLEQKLKKLDTSNIAYSKTQDYVISEVTPQQINLKFVNKFPLIIGYKVFGNNCTSNIEYSSILAVLPFRTSNEVVTLVNNNRVGFAASVWTENIGVANEITTKLKVGIVWVNTHGYISPASSFSPYKDSGNGVIGGDLGLNDFISHTTMCMFSSKTTMNKEVNVLPSPLTNKRIYLYYGGSFKRSESGLSQENSEVPNSKDVRNCVEIAKKGYESWSSLKPKVRGEHILKLATASENIKIPHSATAIYWSSFLHNLVHTCENLKSLIHDGNPSLRVLVEPVGVIALDSMGEPDIFTLKLIAGALAVGNAVIIVNHSDEGQLFFTELCKIMSSSGIPAGVFNVFFNPNDNIIGTLYQHREVQKYYTRLNNQQFYVQQYLRIKNIENYSDENNEILNLVTRNKCVWTCSGETFL